MSGALRMAFCQEKVRSCLTDSRVVGWLMPICFTEKLFPFSSLVQRRWWLFFPSKGTAAHREIPGYAQHSRVWRHSGLMINSAVWGAGSEIRLWGVFMMPVLCSSCRLLYISLGNSHPNPAEPLFYSRLSWIQAQMWVYNYQGWFCFSVFRNNICNPSCRPYFEIMFSSQKEKKKRRKLKKEVKEYFLLPKASAKRKGWKRKMGGRREGRRKEKKEEGGGEMEWGERIY